MATDLREQQGTTSRTEPVDYRNTRPARWPYVATAIVLIVLTGVGLLLLTADPPQPPTSVAQWVANVEGMVTETREGSGFSRPAQMVPTQVDAGAYAEGALTGSREGSSPEPATEVLPDLMTEVREG